MEKIKRREWLTGALVALGLLSLSGGVQKVQAAEKHIVINVQTGTTFPDPLDISVSEQDSVMWHCGTHEFCITKFTLLNGTEKNPFYRPLPFCSTWRRQASSGPAKPVKEDEEYKYTIEVKKGPTSDPHIRIHP